MADTAVTLTRARMSQLSLQERAQGFTNKYTIPYTDVNTGTGSSDTVTVTLGALPAKWAVVAAAVNITTAFAGTTALSIIVGTTTTTNAFIASTSVLTAARIVGSVSVAATTNATATASKSMIATFTNATGGSPSEVTAGSLDIYLAIDNMAAGTYG